MTTLPRALFVAFALATFIFGCAHSPTPLAVQDSPPFPLEKRPLTVEISSSLARAMAFSADPTRSSRSIVTDEEWVAEVSVPPGSLVRIQTAHTTTSGRYAGRTPQGQIVLFMGDRDHQTWRHVPLDDARTIELPRQPKLLFPLAVGLFAGAALAALSAPGSQDVSRTLAGSGIGGAAGLSLGLMMGVDPSYELWPRDIGRRLAP